MLKVELFRFRVKESKSKQVDEWLTFLNEHLEDTLLTLDDEKMYVESIHREVICDHEYLYWYSIQGEGGKSVYESKSYIDIRHLAYWDECIDHDYTNNQIPVQVTLIPHRVREAMK